MNEKTLHKLEYNKIISQLSESASSERGRQLCLDLKPQFDLQEIQTAQEQTAAAFSRIVKKGRPSFSFCFPIESSLKRLEIGATLNCPELLKIEKLLSTTGLTVTYGKHDTVDELPDCLDVYFEQLSALPSVVKELSRCILSEEEISDDASPALRHIRRSISGMSGKIHSTLNTLINGSMRTYLQDALVTMRGDRYCVPVKAEYRNQVSGMIHDQSSTGSTIFIEPMAVVKLNNDLKNLYAQEQEEILIILAKLSALVGEYIAELRLNYDTLTTLDFIFAKGAFALHLNASKPMFNQKGYIHVREGRHPLLSPKTVVPITVILGGTFDLLIITGPNTGGKTVSLKTVGLFTLMGQAGLHIPALDRSELAIFKKVFVDIGDEQSIEQSLSTFSSHMSNIVSFLEQTDSHSLVLFDELGAGTDPTEGAALAIAILSYLHKQGTRTMATTHYSELKVFALTTSGVENASCEFDVASLRPTYRLLIGVPGKSNAFSISSKLGLPHYIIENAKSHLSEQAESFEDLLTDLENKRNTIEKEEAEIKRMKAEIRRLEEHLSGKTQTLDSQKQKIINEANERAATILKEAKEFADETIRQFHKFGKENISASEMEKARTEVRKRLSDANPSADALSVSAKKQHKPSDFKLGILVKVCSMNLTGTVNSLPDAKGNLFVQMGIIRSSVNITDLEIIEEAPLSLSPQGSAKKGKMKLSKTLSIRPEINLLGKTVDEAIASLDKYLDDAYIAHLNPVRIVHGKGTGALRAGIHRYLKTQKHVKTYRLASFGEGDAGVTIVEFK